MRTKTIGLFMIFLLVFSTAGSFRVRAAGRRIFYIEFDGNGGKGAMDTVEAVYGVKKQLPANTFKKTGYHFTGWRAHRLSSDTWYAVRPDGKKGWYKAQTIQTNGYQYYIYKDKGTYARTCAKNGGTVVMQAQWERNTYTVQFDGNGASSGSMDTQEAVYGVKRKLPKNRFSKEYCQFAGWRVYRPSSGEWYAKNTVGKKGWYTAEKIAESGYDYVVLSDRAVHSKLTSTNGMTIVMQAQWAPNAYTVQYDGNGASSGEMPAETAYYGVKSKLSPNAFAKKYHRFTGWHAQRLSDNTWYAVRANGKKGWYTEATIAAKGYAYALLPDQGAYSKLCTLNGDTVLLHAQWEKGYVITYRLDGGENDPANPAFIPAGSGAVALKDPVKAGHTFEGWYKDANFTKQVSEIPAGLTKNMTLYAKWKRHYVVVLDPGHAAEHPGASYFGFNEHILSLKVAKYCKSYLNKHYPDVTVLLTRNDSHCLSTDLKQDLEMRCEFAKQNGADCLVSMHFNATGGHTATGCLCFVSYRKNVTKTSQKLANRILDELCGLGLSRNGSGIYMQKSDEYFDPDGTPQDWYAINRHCANRGIPGIIVEHCFLDTQPEYFNTDAALKKLGVADAKGIAAYLGLE